MSRRKTSLAAVKPTARSRVTNGRKLFLPGVDGRSILARRARDVASAIAADLGGAESLSEAQKQLVRRAAMIGVSCEQMEAQAANGQEINLDLFGKLTDRLGRTLQRLGIKRVARNVTPTLAEYLKSVAGGAA